MEERLDSGLALDRSGSGFKPGRLISIEGVDGAGKSTVAAQLVDKLRETGCPVLLVREPGGTRVSEMIREILLDPLNQEMTPRTEAMLYAAARLQLISQVIAPNLAAGRMVICDRYTDSTLAYQGGGRGLEADWLRCLNQLATRGLAPDLTLLLDLEPNLGRIRRSEKYGGQKIEPDRLEAESETFYTRVRQTYLRLAQNEPGRIKVLDAGEAQSEVAAKAWRIVRELLRD